MIAFIEQIINPCAWVLGNLLIAYDAAAIVIFIVGYYVLFDPGATTAGKVIFRFFVSLVGLIMLVFIGTYIDPTGDRSWLDMPGEVDAWHPVLRVLVYGHIAFTVTSLAILLVLRKWYPHKLRIAPNEDLVKPRHETNEIPVAEKH